MQAMGHVRKLATSRAGRDAKVTRRSGLAFIIMLIAVTAIWSLPACAATVTTHKVAVDNLADAVQITVTGSAPISMTDSRLAGRCIVFDLKGGLAAKEQKRVDINAGGIMTVRCGWYQSSPPVVRISVVTSGKREYSIRYEDGKRRAVIKIAKAGATSAKPAAKAAGEPISSISMPEVTAEPVLSTAVRRADRSEPEAVALEPGSAAGDARVLVASSDLVAADVRAAFVAAPEPVQPRVSLDFVASDIHDILKALAMQSRSNIVASPDVKGEVTASLNNVTVEEALRLVTSLSGFKFAKVDGSYVVGTADNLKNLTASGASSSGGVRLTEVVALRYANPAVVTSLLEKEFGAVQVTSSAGDGKETTSPTGPSFVVLSGSPADVQAAKTMVTSIEQAAATMTESSVIELYEVKYADIKELAALLASTVPGLKVTIGPNQGFDLECPSAVATGQEGVSSSSSATAAKKAPPTKLILQGTVSEIERAKELLAKVDVQQPQIMIEAKVIDISSDAGKGLGITWSWDDTAVTFAETRGATAQALTIGRIARNALTVGAAIQALTESGKGRILANPNVLAIDGKPASIFIGDEVKYVVSIQPSSQGTATITTETAKVGIQLHCVSRISSDGYITMDLHPEVSVIKDWIKIASAGIELPEISRRYVDSTIRVKDGETIVIGGLIKDEEIESMSGIPLLKDLPIIGGFFKSKTSTKAHSEIMMFITPRILTSS